MGQGSALTQLGKIFNNLGVRPCSAAGDMFLGFNTHIKREIRSIHYKKTKSSVKNPYVLFNGISAKIQTIYGFS